MSLRSAADRGRFPGFNMRFRGFDRTEVVSALAKLASENDEARRQMERLDAEIERLQQEIGTQVDNERHVQRALVEASRTADDIRARAELDAKRLIAEAQERGEQIVQGYREQVKELEAQIESLIARRRDVEAMVEALINAMTEQLEQSRRSGDGSTSSSWASTA